MRSPRFGMNVPHILDVPGRDYILIHPGNFPEDTEGCVLVGKEKTLDTVLQSREAFRELMTIIGTEADVWITFKEMN
jgi:hypothetical protein